MSSHFFLSATNSLHLLTPSTWRSPSTSTFHLFLGLPLLLIPSNSWVKIFLGILSSSILSRHYKYQHCNNICCTSQVTGVIRMPVLFMGDTAQSIRKWELPHKTAWGVTHLHHQMSDSTEVTDIAVNYFEPPTASGYFFTHFAHTHTHTRKLNKLWTNLACFKRPHSPEACHLFNVSHLQFIRPTADWTCHFSAQQHSTEQRISFLAQTFTE